CVSFVRLTRGRHRKRGPQKNFFSSLQVKSPVGLGFKRLVDRAVVACGKTLPRTPENDPQRLFDREFGRHLFGIAAAGKIYRTTGEILCGPPLPFERGGSGLKVK